MVLQKAPNSNKPISRTCAVLFLRHMAFYSGGTTWNTVRSHGAGICLGLQFWKSHLIPNQHELLVSQSQGTRLHKTADTISKCPLQMSFFFFLTWTRVLGVLPMPISSFEIIYYLCISVVGEMLVAECIIIKISKRIETICQKINKINPQQLPL